MSTPVCTCSVSHHSCPHCIPCYQTRSVLGCPKSPMRGQESGLLLVETSCNHPTRYVYHEVPPSLDGLKGRYILGSEKVSGQPGKPFCQRSSVSQGSNHEGQLGRQAEVLQSTAQLSNKRQRKFNAKGSKAIPTLCIIKGFQIFVIQDIGVISIDSPIKMAVQCSAVTKPAKSKCFGIIKKAWRRKRQVIIMPCISLQYLCLHVKFCSPSSTSGGYRVGEGSGSSEKDNYTISTGRMILQVSEEMTVGEENRDLYYNKSKRDTEKAN